jgi:hypothetical protein
MHRFHRSRLRVYLHLHHKHGIANGGGVRQACCPSADDGWSPVRVHAAIRHLTNGSPVTSLQPSRTCGLTRRFVGGTARSDDVRLAFLTPLLGPALPSYRPREGIVMGDSTHFHGFVNTFRWRRSQGRQSVHAVANEQMVGGARFAQDSSARGQGAYPCAGHGLSLCCQEERDISGYSLKKGPNSPKNAEDIHRAERMTL